MSVRKDRRATALDALVWMASPPVTVLGSGMQCLRGAAGHVEASIIMQLGRWDEPLRGLYKDDSTTSGGFGRVCSIYRVSGEQTLK